MYRSSARTAPLLATSIAVIAALSLPAVAAAAPRGPTRTAGGLIAFGAPQLPNGATSLGAMSPTARLTVGIVLEPRDPAALNALVDAVSTRSSPLFRHYLRRGTFAARFGPSSGSIARSERYFSNAGLSVLGLSSNHLLLEVGGSVARFEGAFRTELDSVRLRGGTIGRATASGISMPSNVAAGIAAVVGLDQLSRLRGLTLPQRGAPAAARRVATSFVSPPRVAPRAPAACPAATWAAQTYDGITDSEVAQAYGADGLYRAGDFGAGQTIAVFELEPFAMSDLRAFDGCYFGAAYRPRVQVVPVDGGAGIGFGSGEASTDVEILTALAPAADLKVYEAPNTDYGLIDEYDAIVSDDTAQLVSTSWGECEQDALQTDPGQLVAEHVLFEQAAAQGQTVFAASGDNGSDDCGVQPDYAPAVSVDDPASQPDVVGVGGTSPLSVAQPPKEKVWNDGFTGGGSGGGVSTLWAATPWQRSAIANKSNASSCHATSGLLCRGVPDVSAFADERAGITIYYGGEQGDPWFTLGGTSIAAPTWAAMLAEVNDSAACRASPRTAHGVGFVAPLLYDVASNPTDYDAGFTDVTMGNNDISDATGMRYAAGPGYNLATGLGTPELTPAPGVAGPGLADSLCAIAQGNDSPRVVSVTPSAGPVSGGTTFTITGSGFAAGGRPDVRSVNFGTSPATFRVVSDTEITGTTRPDTDTANSGLSSLNGRTGIVQVSITKSDGSVALGPRFTYRAIRGGRDAPVVFHVGPTGGRGAGGTRVVVYGSDFLGATRVTFGGRRAAFHVVSDTELVATSPPAAEVRCAVDDPSALGLCQAQVVVTGASGAKSTPATIFPPFMGNLSENAEGAVLVPPRCRCEAYPSVSEFDYVTHLRLTRVVTPSGRPFENDPYGSWDTLTLRGVGFNILTVNWVDVGPPNLVDSQDEGNINYVGRGTVLQMSAPADPTPSDRLNRTTIELDTIAGASNAKFLYFGPIQEVDSVSTEVVSTTGGQTVVLHGGGFVGADQVMWESPDPTVLEVNQPNGFHVDSDRELTLTVPPLAPGSYQLVVCGAYGCGGAGPTGSLASDTISANAPGMAVVTSAEQGRRTPAGGVAGGTTFELQGTNFGPIAQVVVEFVNQDGAAVDATAVSAGPPPTDPGATETILVTSPPALDGYPVTDWVVLTGADGSSGLNNAAVFAYG